MSEPKFPAVGCGIFILLFTAMCVIAGLGVRLFSWAAGWQ